MQKSCKMTSKVNVHVTYASKTFIYIAPRNNFLSRVCKKYGLNEEEIEIYDLKKQKYIDVDDLKDFDKVEINPAHLMNGKRDSPEPSTSKEPDRKDLIQKLLDNRTLTGAERAFMIQLLESHDCHPLKRKKEDDSVKPAMKNRKVQVDAANLISSRAYSTQTDELLTHKPSPNSSIATNDIRIQSKKMAASEKIDTAIASDLMSQSFQKRRNFIYLERPLAAFVKEQYPLLFSNAEVRKEIDRIFYDGKCVEFLANIEKYSTHILSVARDDDPLLLTTRKKMSQFETAAQKKYAQDVGALLMLSPLVFEDREFLKVSDKDCNPGDFPFIQCNAKLHDLYFDNHIFRVFVERTLLCEASDFKEAILCLIAGYFIFNIQYPEANFSTLVVFEKLFLEANDTDDNDIEDAVKQIIRSIQLKWQAKSGS